MLKKFGLSLAIAAMTAVSVVSSALATSYDLDPVAAPFTGQITSVLTTVLPIAGGLLALMVGWKVFKRFSRG